MFSKFFIERPILSNVLAIVTMLLGVVTLFRLPVAQYPEITPPVVQVTATYPGAGAEVLADTVAAPIEQEVNGVENMLYMSSKSSSDGSYTLTVTFEVGTDLNMATILVQNRVNVAMARLPDDVTRQGVSVKKMSSAILQTISLSAPDGRYGDLFISNYATLRLKDELARLRGVGDVTVYGAASYSMRVWLDPEKLKGLGMTPQDVVQAISEQNVQVAAGRIGQPPSPPHLSFQYAVQTTGRLTDVHEFENIIVKTASGEAGKITRVRDVGRVELGGQTYDLFAQKNGNPACLVAIYLQPGANALDVAKSVRATMAGLSRKFPAGLVYEIPYDTTRFVEAAVEQVYHTLIEAAVLVLLVIMLFLQDWKAMLVPATTVPVTILGAFVAMAALGFSVNLITLFGIILAIGIVVDDAIIVVEGAAHHLEHGLSAKDAAIKAMDELFGPIIGITLVLSAVFIPAAFMSGITGQLYRQFALVIASTALISAANAATLKPTQCALWLRPIVPGRNFFFRGFNWVYDRIERAYTGIVRFMVGHAWVLMLLFLVLIGVTFKGFASLPTGFLPTEDQGYALISIQLPGGASLGRTSEVVGRINDIIGKTPGVADWITFGGMSMLDSANVPNAASTFVIYKDWKERGKDLSQEAIVSRLQREFSAIEEAIVVTMVPPAIQGIGQAGGFEMVVQDRGDLGPKELDASVQELIRAGRGQAGLRALNATFEARTPQLFVDIDRTQAKTYGVLLSDLFGTLQAYLGSAYVNDFNKFGRTYQVRVQADTPFRQTPGDIGRLEVRSSSGKMTPIASLVNVRDVTGPQIITRYNLYTSASVYGGAAPGFSSGQALSLMEEMALKELPGSMGTEWTTMAFQEKKVGSEAYYIFALAVLLVFLVLSAQYESWSAPAAVILAVPLALLGTFAAVSLRGMDNNVYTQIGVVLLIALASKNAILIVEFARELRAKGMAIPEAAVEASRLRFRPILMTSFAFILGVVPLLTASGAGAASQRALGTAVFGGMIASTLLAVLFVPVFYVVIQRLSEGRRRRGVESAPEDAGR